VGPILALAAKHEPHLPRIAARSAAWRVAEQLAVG